MKFNHYIIESSKDDYTGIFLGRIQGLTTAHVKIINTMSATHPQNYVVIIKGDKSSLDTGRNPIPFEVQEKMVKRVLPSNVKIITAKSANLENILPDLEGKAFAVYAGTDRVQDYRKYAAYIAKQGYNVKVIDIPREANDVSATKLRQSLKDNDIEAFKKVAPKEVWDMFDELRQEILR